MTDNTNAEEEYELIVERINEYHETLLYCHRKLEEYVYYCLRCIGKYMPYRYDDFIVIQKEEDTDGVQGFTIMVVFPKPQGDMDEWGKMSNWNILFYYGFTYEYTHEFGSSVVFHDSLEEYEMLFGE